MDIAPGQRYRKLDVPYIVWEVSTVQRGPDEVLYARLRRLDDRVTTKTYACSVLQDTRVFNRIPPVS